MDTYSISVIIKSGWFELRKKREEETPRDCSLSLSPSLHPPHFSPLQSHPGKTTWAHTEKATQREPSADIRPVTTWVSGFQPPEWWENKFLLWKPPAHGVLLWQPRHDNTGDAPSSHNHAVTTDGCGHTGTLLRQRAAFYSKTVPGILAIPF